MDSGDEVIPKEETNFENEKISVPSSIWMTCLKIYLLLVCVFVISTQLTWTDASILDWLCPKKTVEDMYQMDAPISIPSVPFEMTDSNDIFISDTSKILGAPISKLDICQQKVILSLKSTCKILKDDELDRLGIQLLNCQHIEEGLPIIECSKNMPIKNCLSQMTLDIQTEYKKILERTKTICLGIRQDQFRGMAELTVNRLVESTHQHLSLVERLKSSQANLEKAALHSIDELGENQMKLLEKHQELLKLAHTQKSTVESNIKDIQNEKNLIKTGKTELNAFIIDLKKTFKVTIDNLHEKNAEVKSVFDDVFKELARINDLSYQISISLDQIRKSVTENDKEATKHLKITIGKLTDIHKITQNFAHVLDRLKFDFQRQLNWIEKNIGTDKLVHRLGIIIIHIVYLLIGMVCLLFVNSDVSSRAILLGATSVNFISVFKDFIKLDILLMTKTIIALLLVNAVIKILINCDILKRYDNLKMQIQNMFQMERKIDPENLGYLLQMEATLNNIVGMDLKNDRDENNDDTRESTRDYALSKKSYSSILGMKNTSAFDENKLEPKLSAKSSIHNMGRCKAITLNGSQCQFMTPSNDCDYCKIHDRIPLLREK